MVEETMAAAEKENWVQKNQGNYEISLTTNLNAKAYQEKLLKERDILEWVKKNANTIVKPDLAIAARVLAIYQLFPLFILFFFTSIA